MPSHLNLPCLVFKIIANNGPSPEYADLFLKSKSQIPKSKISIPRAYCYFWGSEQRNKIKNETGGRGVSSSKQESAMVWDETEIAVPGWDRDWDDFSGISGIRDGTGMSFGKPGWDRDAPLNTEILAIPDLFEIEKMRK